MRVQGAPGQSQSAGLNITMSEQGPRYATVGDYLRVMRRRRLMIGLIVTGSVMLSLGLSLSQPTEYTASARISFRDPLQDLPLLGQGGQIFPDISPIQRATIEAEQITSPQISRRVRDRLDATTPADALAAAVSTEVDQLTNIVTVSATWGDASFAAELATAFTEETAQVGIADARRRLTDAEDALEDDLRDAQREEPPPGIRISILEANLQRLQGLLTITDPVRVLERAETPGGPSSPQVGRSVVLGFIFGLVVAIISAFIRDALDRRLHNAQEVHEEIGLPILGRIGSTAFAYAGLASNGQPPPSETHFEAFRVLRMNLAYLSGESPPRSVLITSPLPQEGKSTVSMSLASAAALAGQRVLLVECDLRRPSLARRLKIQREPGLSDYLNGSATPDEILQVVNLRAPTTTSLNGKGATTQRPDVAASMVVIAAGQAVGNAPELLQSPRFETFLDKVAKAYDLVVLDGGPVLSVADPLELVSEADAILICVRVQQTTRDQLRAARAALSHLPERPTGVVVTGLRHGDETYEYYYGY